MKERPSWDEYFMDIAKAVAKRTSCLNREVGAIIVRDKQILSTGYNGPPSGAAHCEVCVRKQRNIPSGEQLDVCYAIHAEQNAIILAAKYGISIKGGTLYSTLQPCSLCSKFIANSGLAEVVYEGKYESWNYPLLHASIDVRTLEPPK